MGQSQPADNSSLEVVEGVLEFVSPCFSTSGDVISKLSKWHLAWTHAVLGTEALNDRRYHESLALLERSLQAFCSMHCWKPAGYLLVSCLSTARTQTGQYTKAQEHLEVAIEIHMKHGGLHEVDYAMAWHNLAHLQEFNLDYMAAAASCSKGLDFAKHYLPLFEPVRGWLLQRSARIQSELQNYEEAETLYLEALETLDRNTRPGRSNREQVLSEFAMMYVQSGQHIKAEPILKDVIERCDAVRTVMARLTLVALYRTSSRFSEAQPLLSHTVSIICENMNRVAPHLVRTSLEQRARLAFAMKDFAGACSLYHAAAQQQVQQAIQLISMGANEKTRLDFLERSQSLLDEVLSASLLSPDSRVLTNQAYDVALLCKATNFNVQRSHQETAITALSKHFERRKSLVQETIISTLSGTCNSATWQTLADVDLEIARMCPGTAVAEVILTSSAQVREVLNCRPLLEFVQYERVDFEAINKPRLWKAGDRPQRCTQYCVFVVGCDGTVRLFNLGGALDIDELINGLFMSGECHQLQRKSKLHRACHELTKILLPLSLVSNFKSAEQLIVAPDGKLWTVPFALLLRCGHALPEQFQSLSLSYVHSGRDLVSLKRPQRPIQVSGPLIMARPAYFLDDDGHERQECDRGLSFEDLPSTETESLFLHGLLSQHGYFPRLLLGMDATVAELRGAHAPVLLHIGTHGFYVRHSYRASASDTLLEQALASVQNPLLRCGLAFAGAQNVLQQGSSVAGVEDSILTAHEITSLDLHGTELVVLACCQSGCGDIRLGEGVQSLAQSFMIAGAKSVLVAICNIKDRVSMELIEYFYQALLVQGLSRAAALQQAQTAMSQKFPPSDWGGFMLLGDSSPFPFETFQS